MLKLCLVLLCFCKCVNRCLVFLCKILKRKVKRFRFLFFKWLELLVEVKDLIIKEFRKCNNLFYILFFY